jgi:membrane associated rhomboid family serine protease
MIRDRDYMRDPSGGGRSLTIDLIIILIALFVVQACLFFYGGINLINTLGLSLDGIKHGHVWQLLTFQFLHSVPWPWHVLFNCLGLYFFGRTVEETLGRKRFLALYFAGGFAGGALQLLTTWILPYHADGPVVGASAGIMTMLALFAILFPMREVTIFILFFPVTLRVQYVYWFLLGISIFGTIIPFDGIAHAAHLGGMLTAIAYLRWGHRAEDGLSRWSFSQLRQRKRTLSKPDDLAPLRARRTKSSETPELPSGEFISQEVDPILDKISAHGIQSLTDRERQILQAARSKMSKR